MPRSTSSQTRSPHATRPARGATSPATTRSTLLLPAPDGPASARHSPAATSSATSSSRSPSRCSAVTASPPISVVPESIALEELDRQQDRDRRERPRRRRAERARGVEPAAVERPERRLGLAQVVRRGDERERHHHAGGLERELDAGVLD